MSHHGLADIRHFKNQRFQIADNGEQTGNCNAATQVFQILIDGGIDLVDHHVMSGILGDKITVSYTGS